MVDTTSSTSCFDACDLKVDDSAQWYPSPPAEDPFTLFDFPSSPLDVDLNLALFGENISSSYPSSPAYHNSPQSTQDTEDQPDTTISFSTTFYPGNPEICLQPDLVISSEDGTLFYLNSRLLASSGFNVFSLPPLQAFSAKGCPGVQPTQSAHEGPITRLPDSSTTLDIIFHLVYGISCAGQAPSFDSLSHAITRMPDYNLSPSALIHQGTPLFMDLMAKFAPFHPLKLYALAAHHGIEALAVGVSSHLLGLNLSEISDELAVAMGSVYLKRLFFMHKGRTERLKNILARTPTLHDSDSDGCDVAGRDATRRKWALLVTALAWDARPDISPHAIQEHFRLSGESIGCRKCQKLWQKRCVEVATEWATVKFTI